MMEGTDESQHPQPESPETEFKTAPDAGLPPESDTAEPEMNSEQAEPADPMAQLEAEAQKWRETAMRNQAELENFRKRMSREKLEAIKFGNSSLLEGLLPVIDNFRFGLDAARQEGEESDVFKGMAMVAKQIEDFLADQGVVEVPAEGLPFDPNLHDAVKHEHDDAAAEGHVHGGDSARLQAPRPPSARGSGRGLQGSRAGKQAAKAERGEEMAGVGN